MCDKAVPIQAVPIQGVPTLGIVVSALCCAGRNQLLNAEQGFCANDLNEHFVTLNRTAQLKSLQLQPDPSKELFSAVHNSGVQSCDQPEFSSLKAEHSTDQENLCSFLPLFNPEFSLCAKSWFSWRQQSGCHRSFMAQAGLSQLFLYCLNRIAWILTLFSAVILNVAAPERTVKEASLGFHKKTNLNKKINLTTKQKSLQVPCSAPLTKTFLSQYLMWQNYPGDSKFLIENDFVESLDEDGCFFSIELKEFQSLYAPVFCSALSVDRKWLRLGFFCCSGQTPCSPGRHCLFSVLSEASLPFCHLKHLFCLWKIPLCHHCLCSYFCTSLILDENFGKIRRCLESRLAALVFGAQNWKLRIQIMGMTWRKIKEVTLGS